MPVVVRRAGYPLVQMRTMFVTWALILLAGIVYFSVIGLSHH